MILADIHIINLFPSSSDYVSEMSSFYFVLEYSNIRIRIVSYIPLYFSRCDLKLELSSLTPSGLQNFLIWSDPIIKKITFIKLNSWQKWKSPMSACWLSIFHQRAERDYIVSPLYSLSKLVFTEQQLRTK